MIALDPRPTVQTATVVPEAIVQARAVEKTYRQGRSKCTRCWRRPRRGTGRDGRDHGPEPGSGKTTLLNCLSGLDSIDEGEVLIEGVSLASKSDRQRTDYRARRMGFVFQFYNLMPVLTAVENVSHARRSRPDEGGASDRGPGS